MARRASLLLTGYGNGYGYGDGIYYAKIFGEWFEVSGEIENSLCKNLPEKHYDKIDKTFISKVTNLESLRSLREKIGIERYIELLGAKEINAETDLQGNEMKLYKCNEAGESSILLQVLCPSTKRMYHLYPPNQSAKTCMEAKRSTFGDNPIMYRHGDIALVNVNDLLIKHPILET